MKFMQYNYKSGEKISMFFEVVDFMKYLLNVVNKVNIDIQI